MISEFITKARGYLMGDEVQKEQEAAELEAAAKAVELEAAAKAAELEAAAKAARPYLDGSINQPKYVDGSKRG